MSDQETQSNKCPSCFSVETKKRLVRNDVTILNCEKCSLDFAIANTDIPTFPTDPLYYKRVMDFYDRQLEIANEILPARVGAYERLLGRSVKRVLEVGCGSGVLAEAFHKVGIEYVGIEIDETMAKFGQERTKLDIRFGDVLELPGLGEFDAIFFSQVLEHAPNPTRFLQHLGTLAPNGLLHMDVPNHGSFRSILRKWFDKKEFGFIQQPHHMIAYDQQSLRNLLKRAGFDADMCEPVANNHEVWGQLMRPYTPQIALEFKVLGALKLGSLLCAVCRPTKLAQVH